MAWVTNTTRGNKPQLEHATVATEKPVQWRLSLWQVLFMFMSKCEHHTIPILCVVQLFS